MNPIARMLIDMARFYGQDLDERQLAMYVEVLAQFDQATVLQAGKEYLRNTRNTRFPIPPHKILEKYLPPEPDAKDMGRELALRIREAVSKFGWPSPIKAKEFIGEAGWSVVTGFGGWSHICENLGVTISESTFMAQCRDVLESRYKNNNYGLQGQNDRVQISQNESKKLLEKINSAGKQPLTTDGGSDDGY